MNAEKPRMTADEMFDYTIERSRRAVMEESYYPPPYHKPRVFVSRGLMDALCANLPMKEFDPNEFQWITGLSTDEGYIGAHRVKIIADNRVWCAVVDPQ